MRAASPGWTTSMETKAIAGLPTADFRSSGLMVRWRPSRQVAAASSTVSIGKLASSRRTGEDSGLWTEDRRSVDAGLQRAQGGRHDASSHGLVVRRVGG